MKIGKKSGLKYFDYNDIKSWNPCYDPIKFVPKNWRGTTIDILNLDSVPFQDRLWCVLRTELMSDRVMRLFAVWSYRQTLKFITNPDPRSVEAANVAEKFANGEATYLELSVARSAAESAAWNATRSAAWNATRNATRSATSASQSAAESAAESAASAAWNATRSAAWNATRSATSASQSASQSAARSAAESAQKDKLIEMILIEGKQRAEMRKRKLK